MTEQDKNLRQGRSQDKVNETFKLLEFVGSLSLIAFAVYMLLRPWL